MANHTPEPWSIDKYGCVTAPSVTALHRSIEVGGFALSGSQLAELNSQRIVACVNACKGLSNEDLENGALFSAAGIELFGENNEIKILSKQLAAVTAQRDELSRQVQSLIGSKSRYSIEMQIAEAIIDPDWDGERTPSDWEYEHPIHDKIIGLKTDIESLKAQRDELLELLKSSIDTLKNVRNNCDLHSDFPVIARADAAIAKCEVQNDG